MSDLVHFGTCLHVDYQVSQNATRLNKEIKVSNATNVKVMFRWESEVNT